MNYIKRQIWKLTSLEATILKESMNVWKTQEGVDNSFDCLDICCKLSKMFLDSLTTKLSLYIIVNLILYHCSEKHGRSLTTKHRILTLKIIQYMCICIDPSTIGINSNWQILMDFLAHMCKEECKSSASMGSVRH